MSDAEFESLMDEVQPFAVGPSVEEYLNFVNEDIDKPYTFVFDDNQIVDSKNTKQCLAA